MYVIKKYSPQNKTYTNFQVAEGCLKVFNIKKYIHILSDIIRRLYRYHQKALFNTIQNYLLGRWKRIYNPQATLRAHIVDCPKCGCRVKLPKLRQGQEASCPRCQHHLVHIELEPYQTVIACALSSLILILLVYSLPFANISMAGVFSPLTLPNMINALLEDSWRFLSAIMFVLTFGTPILFSLLALYVYLSLLKHHHYSTFLLMAIRILTRLRLWIMVDVFFISMLVAYIKIKVIANVSFGPAFWLMPLLILLLLRTSRAISDHWLYKKVQQYSHQPLFEATPNNICCSRCLCFTPPTESICSVCHSELFKRRPHSLFISSMLLLAAAILYIPANLLPIMISENPMQTEISTIMSGIIYMWNSDDKLIASVIFSASVAVPSLKIISILLLLLNAKFHPFLPSKWLAIQYHITETIGRWSMIDIFVIIIMMTTFHTSLAKVTAGPAALYFCLVVILTMLSAYFFDMRLIWDKFTSNKQSKHKSN